MPFTGENTRPVCVCVCVASTRLSSSHLAVLSVKGLQSFHVLWADVLRIAGTQFQLHEVGECP